ncbi:MAG TPA: PAS domain S-box protein, partial [bacterium]
MTTPQALGPPRPDAGGDDERDRRLAALERERDELRAALETSKANFRSAFHATPAGMSLARVDNGKILDMNDAFLRILGFGREEVIGRTSVELNLWVTGTQRDALIGELRATGHLVAREVPMRRRDGAIVTVLFTAVPTVVGGETHTITWVLDISERRRAEEALRESEARWRSLVTQAPATILELDRDGTVLYLNRSLTGRPAAAIIGRDIFDFVGEAAAVGRVKLAEAFATGRTVHFDFSMPALDGGRLHAESTLAPVVIDGAVHHVIAVVNDTTAHVAALLALADGEQRFRDMVESMGDWYWEMDAVGRLTSTSEHCLPMLGRAPAQMLGHSPVEFAAPDDQTRQRQYLAEHGNPPLPVRDFTGWYLHADGRRVCIAVSGVPVFGPGGALAGWRGVARDVTARVREEEQRRAIEVKMQQAQKFESLGILAGGIAHDFNNLLHAVLGNLNVAVPELPAGSPGRDAVEQAAQAARRASDLTRQLLAFGRKQVLKLKRTSLSAVVAHLQGILRRTIREDIRIEVRLSPVLGDVLADAGQIEQVLLNLAINAR